MKLKIQLIILIITEIFQKNLKLNVFSVFLLIIRNNFRNKEKLIKFEDIYIEHIFY